MSFIKNIKSLFVEEELVESQKEKGKELIREPEVKPIETVAEQTPKMQESHRGAPGKPEKKFTDILFKAMNDNNREGFDYLEYKQSLLSLKKMNMDEETRYKSAFAMAQTMGITPQYLLETAQHYVAVLEREEAEFEKAMKGQMERNVTTRKQQQQQLQKRIEQMQSQIRKLQQEIKTAQEQQQQMNQEIQEALTKTESVKNNFIASYNVIAGQIRQDIENMKKYLK